MSKITGLRHVGIVSHLRCVKCSAVRNRPAPTQHSTIQHIMYMLSGPQAVKQEAEIPLLAAGEVNSSLLSTQLRNGTIPIYGNPAAACATDSHTVLQQRFHKCL